MRVPEAIEILLGVATDLEDGQQTRARSQRQGCFMFVSKQYSSASHVCVEGGAGIKASGTVSGH